MFTRARRAARASGYPATVESRVTCLVAGPIENAWEKAIDPRFSISTETVLEAGFLPGYDFGEGALQYEITLEHGKRHAEAWRITAVEPRRSISLARADSRLPASGTMTLAPTLAGDVEVTLEWRLDLPGASPRELVVAAQSFMNRRTSDLESSMAAAFAADLSTDPPQLPRPGPTPERQAAEEEGWVTISAEVLVEARGTAERIWALLCEPGHGRRNEAGIYEAGWLPGHGFGLGALRYEILQRETGPRVVISEVVDVEPGLRLVRRELSLEGEHWIEFHLRPRLPGEQHKVACRLVTQTKLQSRANALREAIEVQATRVASGLKVVLNAAE